MNIRNSFIAAVGLIGVLPDAAIADMSACKDALVLSTYSISSDRMRDHRLAELVSESTYHEIRQQAGLSATIFGIPMGASWDQFQSNRRAYFRRYESSLTERESINVLWTGLDPVSATAYQRCIEEASSSPGISLTVRGATAAHVSLDLTYIPIGPATTANLEWQHDALPDAVLPQEMNAGSIPIVVARPDDVTILAVSDPTLGMGDSVEITSLPAPLPQVVRPAPQFKTQPGDLPPACDIAWSHAPQRVPTQDSAGRVNLALLAQSTPNASSLLHGFPERHQIPFLADGWYNNCRSWIPDAMPAFAQIDLGGEFLISAIAFGSEYQAFHNDRAASQFSISTSLEINGPWNTVFNSDGTTIVRGRMLFEFTPDWSRYVRIDVASSIEGHVRIDEVEVYGHY